MGNLRNRKIVDCVGVSVTVLQKVSSAVESASGVPTRTEPVLPFSIESNRVTSTVRLIDSDTRGKAHVPSLRTSFSSSYLSACNLIQLRLSTRQCRLVNRRPPLLQIFSRSSIRL
jgi:hypothetical protein